MFLYTWRSGACRRVLIAAAAALAALLFAGCIFDKNPASAPSPSSSLTPTQSLQQLIDSVSTAIEAIRGLEFKRKVNGKALTKQEWADFVSAIFDADSADPYESAFGIELYQLGYVDNKNFSFTSEYRQSYENNVAGFYVPGTDSFYTVGYDSIPRSGWERENLAFIISHELTHALQDQHFDVFSSTIASSVHNSWSQTDFYYAFQHVYEGDAELSCLLFYFTYQEISPSPATTTMSFISEQREEYLDISMLIKGGEVGDPFFINYTAYSPYIIGADFIGDIYQQTADWTAVNSLFQRRNLTMAEIITGSAVTVRRFPVDKLRLLLNAQQSDYWDDDNMGALGLICLFAKQIGYDDANSALGWNGDFLLYKKATSDSLGSFVWAMAFQDTASAMRMYGILQSHVQSRMGASGRLYDSTDTVWASDSTYYSINLNKQDLNTQLVLNKKEVYWLENVSSLSDSIIAALNSPVSTPLTKAPYVRPRRSKVRHFPRIVRSKFSGQLK